ncbi:MULTISPECIES: winged helix-turn-helix domain-containing protein [Aeromonas]|uniref:winged helix-turn-helix domain-containing protein n=1 Tax=Aeromonas TaxID=642 RepID=UPI0021F8A34D|nr:MULTISPECIES: winged helix-turn-helix domain-containing protein [Aeromonas]MCW0505523.1 winged helix-turn-helix domain-containing protein [Aeromonas piscicola]MCX7134044.1 winged helix-turn-helix domain-containing protein [Aeromonas sp.]
MSNKIYKIAEDIYFSAAIFRLSKNEKDIKLSNKEAELLEMLCDEAGSVIPRNILQEALWPNQDNTDTNLNRQILSLRRKLESFGLLDAIDTIPRVGYIFCAPIEVTGEAENTEASAETPAASPRARRQYSRRKYDRYFNPKRIMLFALLIVVASSLAAFIYHYSNENTLRTINLGHVSLYTTSETENALKLKIDTLAPLVKRVPHYEDERVSILIGKEAISYFSIDNKNKELSENVFLLRAGHSIAEELQCVMTTIALQGKNVSHNYYNYPNATVRYHSNCQAPDNWVEITNKSKIIVTMNREIVVATVIATDHQGQTLFNLDSVGDIERDQDDIAVEMKNTIVNFIDQKALISNGMVATLVAALTPPKQKSLFIQLPGGIYLSSYMGGVISWPSRDNLKVIQRNDL